MWFQVKDTTTPDQSRPGSNGNVGILQTPQINLTHRWDPNRYYLSGSEWTWE